MYNSKLEIKGKRAAKSRWKNFAKKNEKGLEQSASEAWAGEVYTLMFHSAQFSSADLLLREEIFSGVELQKCLEIVPEDPKIPGFVVQVSTLSSKPNINISISTHLASVLGINHLRSLEVKVFRPDLSKYQLESVLITIKDQTLSRSDLWHFSQSLQRVPVYKSQRISKNGVRAEVSDLSINSQPVLSGVITENTLVSFRSRSSKFTYLLELSREMWEYSPSGLLYYEKLLFLLETAFERQLLKKTTHEISIVFYCRVYYPELADEVPYEGFEVDEKCIPYLDVYKEVLQTNDLKNTWKDVIKIIKREILFFPSLINWEINLPYAAKKSKEFFKSGDFCIGNLKLHSSLTYFYNSKTSLLTTKVCSLAASNNSNFLEAINLALNKHTYKKNNVTGYSILLFSAGSAIYNTKHRLAKLTKMRLLTEGVKLDLVCLRRHPMHSSPVFVYDQAVIHGLDNSKDFEMYFQSEEDSSKKMSFPFWLKVHWIYSSTQIEGTCNLQSAVHTIVAERPKKFHPLFRLPPNHCPKINFSIEKSQEGPVFGCSSANLSGDSGDEHHKSRRLKQSPSKVALLFSIEKNKRKYSDSGSETPRRFSVDSIRRDSFYDSRCSDRQLSSEVVHFFKKRFSALKRRWSSVFRVQKTLPEEVFEDENLLYEQEALEYYESMWSNLLEPTLLPLTTDFWPREEDLGINQPYQSYVPFHISREEAIQQLVSQRLDSGFQIVQKSSFDAFGNKSVAPDLAFSLGPSYHQIILSTIDDFNINFRIFTPKEQNISYQSKFACYDYTRGKFVSETVEFSFSYFKNWDKKDSYVLGHTNM